MYQLLNSSPDPQTTYVDSTVQTGVTYDYVITSVDSSGLESAPSNEVTATIPRLTVEVGPPWSFW